MTALIPKNASCTFPWVPNIAPLKKNPQDPPGSFKAGHFHFKFRRAYPEIPETRISFLYRFSLESQGCYFNILACPFLKLWSYLKPGTCCATFYNLLQLLLTSPPQEDCSSKLKLLRATKEQWKVEPRNDWCLVSPLNMSYGLRGKRRIFPFGSVGFPRAIVNFLSPA